MARRRSPPDPRLGDLLEKVRGLAQEVRETSERVHEAAREAHRLTEMARQQAEKGHELSRAGRQEARAVADSPKHSVYTAENGGSRRPDEDEN